MWVFIPAKLQEQVSPVLVQSWEGSKEHYPALCSERMYPLAREQQGVGREVGKKGDLTASGFLSS